MVIPETKASQESYVSLSQHRECWDCPGLTGGARGGLGRVHSSPFCVSVNLASGSAAGAD